MHAMPTAPLAPPARPSADPARVLVVDDEPSVRMIARLMLERGGYAVEEADTAAAAEARVRAGRGFDVILLDVSLPDRAGPDLLPELRLLAPAARVVLASGRAEEDVPAHGADGYLPKPFTREQLLAAVKAALAQ